LRATTGVSLIHEFVCEHEPADGDSPLAAGIYAKVPDRSRVLKAIDVAQSEHDHRLADLGRLQDFLHERDKVMAGHELLPARHLLRWGGRCGVRRRIPDIADGLAHLLSEVAARRRLRDTEPVDVVRHGWGRNVGQGVDVVGII
jgi:hypothetical protein